MQDATVCSFSSCHAPFPVIINYIISAPFYNCTFYRQFIEKNTGSAIMALPIPSLFLLFFPFLRFLPVHKILHIGIQYLFNFIPCVCFQVFIFQVYLPQFCKDPLLFIGCIYKIPVDFLAIPEILIQALIKADYPAGIIDLLCRAEQHPAAEQLVFCPYLFQQFPLFF